MNEHIRKGNEALEQGDVETARVEFYLALGAPDSLTRRIAQNRLDELGSEPAPLRIAEWQEVIVPATNSRCCGARAIFVKSRNGGFVAKNCTQCKKSGYAYPSDFPPIRCCGKEWKVRILFNNYGYLCVACKKWMLVADHLPDWADLFPYDPLPAPGDDGWRGI
jgi:hypothetical protein